jgi:ribosomal protein L40E
MAAAAPEPHVEICLRCGAAMEWRHATFQCPRCRYKIGCCEGDTGECRDPS